MDLKERDDFILTNHLSYFSIIFQSFGICKVLPNTKKCVKNLIIFGRIFHISILLGIVYIICNYEHLLFYPSDIIGKFTDIIQLVFPILTHVSAIFETLTTRKEQMKIWIRIIKGNLILKEFKSYLNKKEEKTYIKKFILLNLICFSTECTVITLAALSYDYRWRNHWFTRIFSNIVGRLLNLHYILYIDLICSRIRVINDELKDITNNININEDSRLIYRKIRKIKKMHSCFWDISQSVNSRFGFSLLISITNYFICLTVDCYWMFIHFGRVCEYSAFLFYNKKVNYKFFFSFNLVYRGTIPFSILHI